MFVIQDFVFDDDFTVNELCLQDTIQLWTIFTVGDNNSSNGLNIYCRLIQLIVVSRFTTLHFRSLSD